MRGGQPIHPRTRVVHAMKLPEGGYLVVGAVRPIPGYFDDQERLDQLQERRLSGHCVAQCVRGESLERERDHDRQDNECDRPERPRHQEMNDVGPHARSKQSLTAPDRTQLLEWNEHDPEDHERKCGANHDARLPPDCEETVSPV